MNDTREAGYLGRTVGELVAEDYRRAAAFTELGIDFCCGGKRTVAQACERAGVSPEVAERTLEELGPSSQDPTALDPRSWDLGDLARHIEKVHHAYVRRTLPVLGQWTEKIARVHGRAHPELLEVRAAVAELAGEMDRHMHEEESELFPYVADLGSSDSGPSVPNAFVEALEDDHERAGALTRRIRKLTNGYEPPADACATYSATFALLRDFESDLHRHVHLENNVLFPRALALQAAGAVPTREGTPSDRT